MPATRPAGEVAAAISSIAIMFNEDGERVTKIRLCSKVEALDKLCRHLGMYEDKVRIVGLESELAAISDEEIEGRLIELTSDDFKQLSGDSSEPAATTAPRLRAPGGKEPAH